MAGKSRIELQKIVAVHTEANWLLTKHGLHTLGWTFELSNTKRSVGRCNHNAKVIEVSKWFLDSPAEQITDTLLHEIAHAFVGPSHGHDATWKRMAVALGAEPNRVTEQAVSTAKYNFVMQCPTCERKWYRYRMKTRNHGARCPDCKTVVKIYRINYS